MNATLKGISHTALGIAMFFLPAFVAGHQDIANMTIGAALAAVLNVLLSYTVPTTTGASSRQ